MFIMLTVLGILTGITGGLFGFGGGFVVVPLVYHLCTAGHDAHRMHIAVATSAAVMIVNSIVATLSHVRAQNVYKEHVWPWALYIAVGASMGAMGTGMIAEPWLRWLFLAYVVATLADCLLRRGFVGQVSTSETGSEGRPQGWSGLVIGAIATVLGVGGSVMTVPLLRRLGAPMKAATAAASALSIPVGLVGALGSVASARSLNVALGSQFFGFVHLPAALALTLGGFVGTTGSVRLVGKLPDRLHAQVYLVLLGAVAVAMSVHV